MGKYSASIDIGSNSVLLCIGRKKKDHLEIIQEFSEVTSLGKGLDATGKFSEVAIENTFKVLVQYKAEIEKVGIDCREVLITATEASRVATNAGEFYHRVKKELGLNINIISGEGEAFLTARGVCDKADRPGVIIDIGGASTELIRFSPQPFLVEKSISYPVGVVRLLSWLDAGDRNQRVEKLLTEDSIRPYRNETLIGVAGSVTSLAAMKLNLSQFEVERVHNFEFHFPSDLKFLLDVETMAVETIKNSFPFLASRANVLPQSAWLLSQFIERMGVKTLKVSTYGLRHGLLLEGKIDESFKI